LLPGHLGEPVLSHRVPLLLGECHRSERDDVLRFVVEVSLGYRVELVESCRQALRRSRRMAARARSRKPPKRRPKPGGCEAGVESGAGGVAVVQINADTNQITYRVVAFNLPAPISGPTTGAHIHVQNLGSATGGIVVDFERTGLNTGLVAAGTTTAPDADAILANPQNYYVNLHTTECPSGTIRGQLA
jgi:hypothetical protein